MKKKSGNKIYLILCIIAFVFIYLFYNSNNDIDYIESIFQEESSFLVPKGLESQVDFWKKIFTETSIYSIVYYTPRENINIKQIDAKLNFSISNDDLLNVVLVSDGEEIAKYSVFDLINDDVNIFTIAEVKNKIDNIYDELEIKLHENKTLNESEHIGYARGRKEKFEKAWVYSGKFIDRIKEIFKEEGVPEEIAYLSFIESSFNPNALSGSNALGIFQMIPSTARQYGLIVNTFVDERRDPLLESKAAAKYLNKLHEDFGHWLWAVNAYHSGENNLKKALNWADANYPEKPDDFKGSLKDFQYTKVVEEFPSDDEFNTNTLKYGKNSSQYITLFLAFLESIDHFKSINNANQKTDFSSVKVNYENDYTSEKIIEIQSGDTLSGIAYNNGVSIENIKIWNSLDNSTIHAGKDLILYIEKPPLTFQNLVDELDLNEEEINWVYEYNFSYRKLNDNLNNFLNQSIYSNSTINIQENKKNKLISLLSLY